MTGKFVVLLAFATGVVVASLAYWYHAAFPDSSQATVSIARPLPKNGEPESDPVLKRVISSGPMARPRDFFRAIERPNYLSVHEATRFMSDDEIVLGLEVDGQFRAYPINYLNDHEMVREEIGGLPLQITW